MYLYITPKQRHYHYVKTRDFYSSYIAAAKCWIRHKTFVSNYSFYFRHFYYGNNAKRPMNNVQLYIITSVKFLGPCTRCYMGSMYNSK